MAILESESKEIAGTIYTVTRLGAKQGNKVLLKIAKSLGPLFLIAAGGMGVDAGRAAQAIRDLNEDDFDWVVNTLAASTVVVIGDRESPALSRIFDLHFAGKYEAEFEWLEFAIEVNFAPFFRDLKRKGQTALEGVAGAKTTKTPSPSTSPATSTGASNGS